VESSLYQRSLSRLRDARSAHVKAIFENIGLGVVWSDDYRILLNRAGNQHVDITERINLYNILWAWEVQLGAEARIVKALVDEVERLRQDAQRALRERDELCEVL